MKPLKDLLAEYYTATLGTISENGYPFSSYAPFYYDEKKVYIFISDIATHTQNIKRTQKASVLFIEDENGCDNLFARKRISLQCKAEVIPREDKNFFTIMDAFQSRHDGGIVNMLMKMSDFNLYVLTPLYGEATFGFGEAYTVDGEDMNLLLPRSNSGGHQ